MKRVMHIGTVGAFHLERKVEPHENAAAHSVARGERRGAARKHPGIFLMPGESGAAVHERIPAITTVAASILPRSPGFEWQGLAATCERLRNGPPEQDESSKHSALSTKPPFHAGDRAPSGQRLAGDSACAQEGIVGTVHIHRAEIELANVVDGISAKRDRKAWCRRRSQESAGRC